MADGEPLLLEQVHLPDGAISRACSPATSSTARCTSCSPSATARRSRGSREALEPVALPAREARLLGVEPRSPALLVEGTGVRRVGGVPVEFARTYVRGDRTRYYVERVVVRSSRRPMTSSAAPWAPRPRRSADNLGSADGRRHRVRQEEPMRAHPSLRRIAVLALVAGACSGSTPTAAPASGGAAAPSEAASQAAGASDGASPRPTRRSRSAGRRPRPA